MEVEVWDYRTQHFIKSYPCEGETRVRVDYFGNLEDLAVFEVERLDQHHFKVIDGNKPLTWAIELT